jgi:hypothetical protein
MAIWNVHVCITAIWYIYIWPFGNLVEIWYISPRFGILNKEKSGNPARQRGQILIRLAASRNRKILVWFITACLRAPGTDVMI